MSVSRNVLRSMKKVMGVISTIQVLSACSSQVSCAVVNMGFCPYDKTLYFSGDGVINDSWKKQYSPESIMRVVIGKGIIGIGENAFCGCKALKIINLPNSVNNIGVSAFAESGLETIIACGVTKIGDFAFYNCKNLKKVYMPIVKEIGNFAFDGCSHITPSTIIRVDNLIPSPYYVNKAILKEFNNAFPSEDKTTNLPSIEDDEEDDEIRGVAYS